MLFIYFFVVFVLGVTTWITYFGLQSRVLSRKTKDFVSSTKMYHTKILMVGDSIMRGVGTSHLQHTLQALVEAHSPTSYITVVAKDGARCEEIIRALKEKQLEKYHQVILFCGGMDIIHFSSASTIKKNLEELFIYAKSTAPHVLYISPANVGNAPIFPFPVSYIYAQRSRKFFAISRECAKAHGVTFVDYYSSKNTQYAEDKSHPNDSGYKNLFDLFKKHIA